MVEIVEKILMDFKAKIAFLELCIDQHEDGEVKDGLIKDLDEVRELVAEIEENERFLEVLNEQERVYRRDFGNS